MPNHGEPPAKFQDDNCFFSVLGEQKIEISSKIMHNMIKERFFWLTWPWFSHRFTSSSCKMLSSLISRGAYNILKFWSPKITAFLGQRSTDFSLLEKLLSLERQGFGNHFDQSDWSESLSKLRFLIQRF